MSKWYDADESIPPPYEKVIGYWSVWDKEFNCYRENSVSYWLVQSNGLTYWAPRPERWKFLKGTVEKLDENLSTLVDKIIEQKLEKGM